jgi:radical SAM-linked protein
MTGPGDRRPGLQIRFRFAKLGKVRFTSHRDVARMWERALRRSGLPVAWSEGFSPRPLLSFGLALPTGDESWAEYLDVRLAVPGDPSDGLPEVAELPGLLSPLLPEGIDVLAAGTVPVATGSLQQEVTSVTWELEVLGVDREELLTRVEGFLGSPSFLVRRERKGREAVDDIRPAVRHLSPTDLPRRDHVEPGPRAGLVAETLTQPRGVRPVELVSALGAGVALGRACRTQQWIERDGSRWEPLPWGGAPPAPVAPHAEVRAS